jgi:LacI family transcriptional regulator
LILVPPVGDNAAVLKILSDARMPCVLISPGDPPADCAHVSMDDTQAAREMTEYLLRLGHRRIGFIAGPPSQVAAPRRHAGHVAALRAAGLAIDEALIVPGDLRVRSGGGGCDRLLDLPAPPTALFASNDDMAMGAVVAAQRRGLQVPADLSVAGFDDSPLASLVWPQLTTVRQPVAEMGAAAVDRLVSRPARLVPAAADVPPPNDAVLPHALIERGSTAAPKTLPAG